MNKVEKFLQQWKETERIRHQWTEQAACRGLYEFFDLGDNGMVEGGVELKQLRKICSECPVFEQCLNDTILYSDEYTFRAGMIPAERRRLTRKIGNLTWEKKQEILGDRLTYRGRKRNDSI